MEERIKIVDNNICVDIEQLKKIITDDWQEFYKFYYQKGYRGEYLYKLILDEIANYADGLSYKTEENAQKFLGRPKDSLDWDDLYPKSDVRSIGFEVLNLLEGVVWAEPVESLTTDDIPTILEFFDTPPGKELEAWDKWEKYWANLDYPARRKKLLENAEK